MIFAQATIFYHLMRLHAAFFLCLICILYSAQAQVNTSPKLLSDPDSAIVATTKGSNFSDFESEVKPIDAQLQGFVKNYKYPRPTTRSYDTLLHNTEKHTPKEVPTYKPTTIGRRLYELPTTIPMDYNSYVKRYIDVYTKQRRSQTAKMLGLTRVYFPIFEEHLDRMEMPIELKYLPVVESALNPHARSRVGATGLWQFMLSTGRLYGLNVNSYVDERKDPYKSTEAALRYLKRSYDEFGDWLLAIASYNCGPGNVRKAIRRSGGKRTFWEIRPYLPRETRGYVPAFIAVNYAFNYASSHNIYPVYVDFKMREDTLVVRNLDITLQEIATMTRTDVNVLRYLNPSLKLDRIPYSSRPFVLHVPSEVGLYFASNMRSIRAKYGRKRNQSLASVSYTSNKSTTTRPRSYAAPKGTQKYIHVVKTGEVVGAIAERYGVSARQISYWNNLYKYRIKVGQKLSIYTTPAKAKAAKSYRPSSSAASSTSSAPVVSNGNMKFYTIKSGDTLWGISKKFGVTVNYLEQVNKGLKASGLKPGQTIRVK